MNHCGATATSDSRRLAAHVSVGDSLPPLRESRDSGGKTVGIDLSETSWVFFAAGAKSTSMRRAVAERLAERDSVVIVEQPISILRNQSLPRFDKRHSRLTGNGLCLYRPLHFPELIPLLGILSRQLNRSLLKAELDRMLSGGTRRLVCYDSPSQHHMVGKLGEDTSVYLAVDDRTVTVRGEPIAGELAAEERMLQEVDKVICVSESLAATLRERARRRHDLPISVLSNGYDERLFDPSRSWEEPAIIAAIPRPRILVAGHISHRIDWDGIARSLEARPEWTWVFVGPADRGMTGRIENLASQLRPRRPAAPAPALVWLGHYGVESIAAMIAHCDACAIPYRLNSFTNASSPLKAIEYLAMGAPVISTRVPSLLRYGEAICCVEEGDGESYGKALDQVGTRSREVRMNLSGETWATRALQFRRLVGGNSCQAPEDQPGDRRKRPT